MSVSRIPNTAYSLNQPLSNIFPEPIVSLRAPLTSDKAPIGTLWVWKTFNQAFVLTSIVNNSASWENFVGGEGFFNSLLVGVELAVTPGLVFIGASASNTAVVTIGSTFTTTSVLISSGATGTGIQLAGNGPIGIGMNAVAKTITIGNVTGATAVDINTGTGGFTLDTATGGPIVISSGDLLSLDSVGAITIGDIVNTTNITLEGAVIDVGNSANATAIVIGNTTAASSLNLIAGTGAMVLNAAGLVSVVPSIATVASPTATSTQNFNVIRTIFTGYTTAQNATQAFTIVSSKIATTSGIFVSVASLNASTNGALMTITGTIQATGSIIVSAKNVGAGALGAGDNCLVTVWIIS